MESGKGRIGFFEFFLTQYTLTSTSSPRRCRPVSCSAQSLQCRIQYYARVRYGPSWTRDATRDLGDAETAAPSSVTPITTPIMIRMILPSAGWAFQVTANISIVIDTCADIFVQLMSTQGQAAQSGRYVQCSCCCMLRYLIVSVN